MTKQQYIQRVLLIMNEAGLFDGQGNMFNGADTAQVDRYIEGSYVDAWRRCAGVLPKSWFRNESFKHYPLISSLTEGTGHVVLPSDFYLLNSFKMKGWKKAVYEASVENERTAAIQANEYTRGSQIRPACTTSSKEYETTKQIIVIGADPIPALYPFDNGPVYCSLNNKLYSWVDDSFPYKGVFDETKTYSANQGGVDAVYWNGNLYYASSATVTPGQFDTGDWTAFPLYTNSESGEYPSLGIDYKDVHTGKLYKRIPSAVNTISVVELNVLDGIVNCLNYYSLQKGLASHTIEEAIYIPSAKSLSAYDDNEDLGIDQRVIEPLAYLSASTVFTIFEKYEIAKALEARVVEMFPGFKSAKGNNITIKQ